MILQPTLNREPNALVIHTIQTFNSLANPLNLFDGANLFAFVDPFKILLFRRYSSSGAAELELELGTMC